MANKYKTLRIGGDWSTSFYLGEAKLDFDLYYDVKLPDGRRFVGCRVYKSTYNYHGRGGMDESYSTSTGFFVDGCLEGKLQEGFKMKVNEQITGQELTESQRESRRKELNALKDKRAELERRISELS